MSSEIQLDRKRAVYQNGTTAVGIVPHAKENFPGENWPEQFEATLLAWLCFGLGVFEAGTS
jgi:hypothetical protein